MSEWCRDQTLDAHPAVDTKKVIVAWLGSVRCRSVGRGHPRSGRRSSCTWSNDFYRKGVDFILGDSPQGASGRASTPVFWSSARTAAVSCSSAVDGVEVTGPSGTRRCCPDYFRRGLGAFSPASFRSLAPCAGGYERRSPDRDPLAGRSDRSRPVGRAWFFASHGEIPRWLRRLPHSHSSRPQQRAAMGAKARDLMLSSIQLEIRRQPHRFGDVGMSAPQNPLVSVVIATYNMGAAPAGRSTVGARQARYGNVELIVVDDGSTDGDTGRHDSLSRGSPRAAFPPEERRRGVSQERRHYSVTGTLIGFCDAERCVAPREAGAPGAAVACRTRRKDWRQF